MNNLYLSPEAQDDLSEIKAYIAEDNEVIFDRKGESLMKSKKLG